MTVAYLRLIVLIISSSVSADYDLIDLSDILNVDYMPGSLLMLENPENSPLFRNDTELIEYQGTFEDAFSTMGFHRKMMNEYLCRSYVSQQIISEMKSTRIKRRLGSPAITKNLPQSSFYSLKDNLLEDEGSTKYKSWLKNSATLQDIYQHYDSAQKREAIESEGEGGEPNEDFTGQVTGYGYHQPLTPNNSPAKLGHSGGGGYSYPNPNNNYPAGIAGNLQAGVALGGGLYGGGSGGGGGGYGNGGGFGGGGGGHGGGGGGYGGGGGGGYSGGGGAGYGGGGGGGGGYGGGAGGGYGGGGGFGGHGGSGNGNSGGPEHIIITETGSASGYGGHDSVQSQGNSKKDKLADLFDVALTALAFLSFGMFIVEVIMCISMSTTTTAPAMTMMPMSMSPTAVEATGMNRNSYVGVSGDGTEEDGTDLGEFADAVGEGFEEGGTASDNTGVGEVGRKALGDGEEGTSASPIGVSETSDELSESGDGSFGDVYSVGEGTTGREYQIIFGYDSSRESNDRNTKSIKDGSVGTGTGTGLGGTQYTGDSATGDDDGDRDNIGYRERRDIPVISQPNNEVINELARKILISIEAALVAHQDDGNCLRKSLCENNLYSRNLNNDQKYWIPVWSLGMSWLSGRLIKSQPRATTMLDSLKSALLGLGKADCELIYNNCDLAKERRKRQKRRKKRSY